VPYLAHIAAAFSRKPLVFTEFGNPTCPPGKTSPYERVAMPDEPPHEPIAPDDPHRAAYACLDESEMATYCREVLEHLHADGRLGAYWWCWADYAEPLRETPPFDKAPHELRFGIVRSDGTEKPVAAALASFARERRTVVEAHDAPVDEARYYDELPESSGGHYARFLESRVRARA
jgi:hypothetical protein